jgi:hypothetical protein
VGKVIPRKASLGFAVGAVALGAAPGVDPSKPLANVKHERFCWAIVQGHRLGPAYEMAGFTGKSPRLAWELRHKPCIDARITWLLAQRIEADTRAHHRADQIIIDARLRLIRELERIAYSDVRDVVQWDREAELDRDGNVIGFKDTMKVTPSRRLTRCQAAQVKSVTTKSGSLKIEVHDKLGAIAQLAKILGVAPEPQPQTTNNTQVNVGQVNVGKQDNALETMRRIAFAIALANERLNKDAAARGASDKPLELAKSETGGESAKKDGISYQETDIGPQDGRARANSSHAATEERDGYTDVEGSPTSRNALPNGSD